MAFTTQSLFIQSGVTVLLLLLLLGRGLGQTTTEVNIGVVLDMDSLVGKVWWTAINISFSDFYASHPSYHTRLRLNLRDSKSNDVAAAAAALDLMKNKQVQAIIGPKTSMQADFVIDLGDEVNVPIVSFSATSPLLSTAQHPYFIRGAPDDSSLVNAISALVRAYGWREAVLMYIDNEFGQGIVPSLTYALEMVYTRVTYNSVVSPSASNDQILAAHRYHNVRDGERVMSNLVRFVVIIWVFVVLVLTQSYTASLSSLLVVQNSRPSMSDINVLLKSGQTVGYLARSFVYEMLKEKKVDDSRLKSYESAEECESLLSKGSVNGGIAAAVHEAPYMKLFLAKTGDKYTSIPTFKTAGFGFVNISRAILNLTEGPIMSEIEKRWFNRSNSRQDYMATSVALNSHSLSLGSFWGLFLIAGVASLFALLVSMAIFLKRNWHISSGDSLKERMVDLTSRFFQRDMTTHTFRPLGTSQDGITEDRVHEPQTDIVSDIGYCPNSPAHYSTENDNAPGEQGMQADDTDVHANAMEGRVSTGRVIEIEIDRINHENTGT